MFRKLRLFNMFSSLFRANFQNATHLIGVALSAFHRIPNPLQCLGQGCALLVWAVYCFCAMSMLSS